MGIVSQVNFVENNLILTFWIACKTDYLTDLLCLLLPVTGQTLAQNLENVPRLPENQVKLCYWLFHQTESMN